MENLLSYILAIIVLMAIPGADMAYVVANGMAYGKRGAAVASLGISLGGFVMSCILWLALTLALEATPEAIAYIQVAGGCYLIYLASTLIREPSTANEISSPNAPPFKTLLFRGVITNVTNPKVPIFFFAFIPPFIPTDAKNPALYGFGLGCLLCLCGGLINFGFGLSGSMLSGMGKRKIWGRSISNVILAGLFTAIGVSIISFRLA